MKKILVLVEKLKMPLRVISVIIFMALYTNLTVFLGQSNFQEGPSKGFVMALIICVGLITSVSWNAIKTFLCCFKEAWKNQLNVIIAIGGILFFLLLNGVWWSDSIALFFFRLFTVVIFPLLMVIFGFILKQQNNPQNRKKIAFIIVLFTIDSVLLFLYLGKCYIMKLLLFSVISVIGLFVRMNQEREEKNNRITFWNSVIYTFFVVIVAFIYNMNMKFVGSFPDKASLDQLINCSKMWGQMDWKGENAFLVDTLLYESKDMIQNLFFYFGKISVVLYLLSLVIFAIILYKCLGRKYRFCKAFYPVYHIAYMSIVFHMIMGTLCSFGIVNCGMPLPFAGENEIIMHTMCVILLLHSEYENFKIEHDECGVDLMEQENNDDK